uniref:Yip1 family protein n=1 Tax=Roseihalotalea indica TaxID=2867963 RepID=A0AA49JC02_9BACT|nr:Yip1 family protein [Tunicatimonas sp. TK19036]
MEEVRDNIQYEESSVNESNLFISIWTKPTQTLAYILKHCPEKYVMPLLILGGIVRAIGRATMKDMGDKMPTIGVLAMAIIFGGALGWITYYIYAWGMSATGKWLKGNAEPSEFRTIIAWALVPTVCSLILLVPELMIFGDDLFRSQISNTSTFYSIMWSVFGVLEIILGIWTMVILIKGISLIQKFNTGKSVLNMILPGLVIIIPLIIIGLLIRSVG